MSIKGIKKELYVGKTGINIITSAGKRTSGFVRRNGENRILLCQFASEWVY